jgi:hypothetical protein
LVISAVPALTADGKSRPVDSERMEHRATADIEPAFESFARAPNGGLILATDPFTYLRQQLIADLATRHRLPAIRHPNSMRQWPNVRTLIWRQTPLRRPNREVLQL